MRIPVEGRCDPPSLLPAPVAFTEQAAARTTQLHPADCAAYSRRLPPSITADNAGKPDYSVPEEWAAHNEADDCDSVVCGASPGDVPRRSQSSDRRRKRLPGTQSANPGNTALQNAGAVSGLTR
jgi:hypothetical protein